MKKQFVTVVLLTIGMSLLGGCGQKQDKGNNLSDSSTQVGQQKTEDGSAGLTESPDTKTDTEVTPTPTEEADTEATPTPTEEADTEATPTLTTEVSPEATPTLTTEVSPEATPTPSVTPSTATTKPSTAATKPSTAPSTAATKPSTAPSTATTKPSTESSAPSEENSKPVNSSTPLSTADNKAEQTISAAEVYDKILVDLEMPNLMDVDQTLLKDLYPVELSLLEDYKVGMPMMSAQVAEVAVFKVKDVGSVDKVVSAVNTRKNMLLEPGVNYPSVNEGAEESKIITNGKYILYVMLHTQNAATQEQIVERFNELVK